MRFQQYVSQSVSPRFFLLLALSMSITLPLAIGQTSRGTVTGIVTDPQAATVAGATVDIEGALTGVKRTTKSNEAGLYRFDAVDVGEYSLKVTFSGFQTMVRRGLIVEGGATLSQDVRLEVGTTQSVVEVTSAAVTLQYDT